jgi:signal transduction histidine kinase
MFVWWGPNFTILYNDAYIAFLGRNKHPAVLGRPGREAWYDIWDTIGPMLESVRKTGKATWSEDVLMFFDRELPKEEVYVTFSFSPVFGEDGKVDGVHCACTEVTEKLIGNRRLETLRKLGVQAAEARSVEDACKEAARVLGENPHDIPFAAIYVIDPMGKEARLTASAGLTGMGHLLPLVSSPSEEDRSSPWPIPLVLRTHRATEIEDFRALGIEIPGGPWPEPCQRAIALPIPGASLETPAGVLVVGVGPRRPYNAAYRTFFDLVAGHIGTAISDAKAYEEERRRAEALAELDRAKTAFFSNVSHEFRTPLTLMLGPLQDALASPQKALGGEDLAAAHRNGLRLLKLVNSLLDFARIEAGRGQASFEPVDVSVYTAELASVFRSAVEKAGLSLTIDTPPVDGEVYLDREMWEKIVLNLVSNAFKFTFEGGIIVKVSSLDGHVELEVTDTGTGIPPDELPRLFERFHRVKEIKSRSHEGSGIGLALVNELVKLQGGTLQATSAVGQGTTFHVRIPKGKAHIPQDRLRTARTSTSIAVGAAHFAQEAQSWVGEEPKGDKAFPATEGPGVLLPGRILLADDNADMRSYVKRLLSAYWTVEAVPDGAVALARARQNPPDLVLSDVMMPKLDGFRLLSELRKDPKTRTISVILLSARAGEESRVEGLDAGADDYLVKPFSAQELVARVGSNLRLSKLRKAHQEEIERLNLDLERRVKERTAELEAANKELESFCYSVSHDLRTPLRAIDGFSMILQESYGDKLDAQAHNYLERVRAATQRMGHLIDDLLKLSRIARSEMSMTTVDLSELACTIAKDLQETAPERKVMFSIAPEMVVLADANLMRVVLENLLDNAWKFSEKRAEARIEVGSTTNAGETAYFVRDNGAGFDMKYADKLFGAFQRLHSVTAFDGTGVGLANVQRIIHRHGGRVWAEAAMDQGATFYFTLSD